MVRDIGRLLCVSWVLLCADLSPALARGPGTAGFSFDGGAQLSPGLTFNFTRDVATVGADGLPVPAGTPRFTRAATLAGAPVWTTVESTFSLTRLLGAGLDHDGHTPLLVVEEPDREFLDVYSVAGDEILTAAQTGAGRNRTVMTGPPPDIMRGQIANRAYEPWSGTVCHGLIVLMCTVREWVTDPAPGYRAISTGIVVSQDRGATWQLVFEDLPFAEGMSRGQRWPMQNWWPVDGANPPLTAYFAATDYLYNPGAIGGNAYLFRATRPAVGAPWVLEPTVVPYRSRGFTEEHFHTAALLPYGPAGLRMLVVVGDLQVRNRTVSLTRSDANYTDLAGWQVQEDFHGAAGGGADPGSWSNMFTGCAPGPPGTVITGSDLNAEQLVALDVNDDAPTHPVSRMLYGLEQADGYKRGRVGVVHTPTPERGGPYVATADPASSSDHPNRNRILYSPDGVRWTQAAAPPALNTDAQVHGQHIYMSTGYNSVGLRRTPIPPLLTARPLEVGPGGFQRSSDHPVAASAAYGSIVPLARGPDGRWLLNGVPIDPQPPAAGQVYRLSGSRLAPDRTIGRIDLAGPPGSGGAGATSGPWQMRVWVRSLDPSKNSRVDYQVRDRDNAAKIFRPTNVASTDWVPVLATGILDLPGGEPPHLWLVSNSFVTPHDADVLLAVDALIEGAGYPGYPMPMVEALPVNGTHFPDELATVSGFQCSNAWTVTFAAQVPIDGWDTTVRSASHWPVATLWGDAANYIEIAADSADPLASRLSATVVRDGQVVDTLLSPTLAWERGTAILMSVADAGDGSGVRISAAIAGLPVTELVSSGGGSLATQPVELRLGSHHGQSGTASEVRVSPMVWWGGEIREHEALSPARRAEALQCLTFLDPSMQVDADGDGVCPARDNCPLNSNASQRDTDGDGHGDACGTGVVLHVSSDPIERADYTTVQAAVDQASPGATVIEVTGAPGEYSEGVRIGAGGPLEIFGADDGHSLPVVDGGAGPAIEVTAAAAGRDVTIRGMTLRGAVGIRAQSSTRIEDVTFEQISQVALDLVAGTHRIARVSAGASVRDGLRAAAGTSLTLDRGRFTGLTGRAIELGGAATIFNTLVADSAEGVRVNETGTAQLRHLTVIGNGVAGLRNAAAPGAVTLANSIVFDNLGDGDTAGIPCDDISWSDVGSIDCRSRNDNLQTPPLLDPAFRPTDASPCLDHGPGPAEYTGVPPTDADGDLRSRDFDGDLVARPDCGAFERGNPSAPAGVVDLGFDGPSTLRWSPVPGAASYRLHRGELAALAYDAHFPCRDDLDADRSDATIHDPEVPDAPAGFYYLVGIVTADGRRDTLGEATGTERSDLAPCP